MVFSDVVEAVKRLSTEEKQEIQMLLQQYICEEQRNELYNSCLEAKAEGKKDNLMFSSDIEELKKQLFED